MHNEHLQRVPCPRGCGAEVLLGDDGVTFETRPRWFLERPHPYRASWHPYAHFTEPSGLVRMVQRNQCYPEHECRLPNSPEGSAPGRPAPAV